MKNKIQIIGLLMTVFAIPATAQNNPIFFGGAGDGANSSGYAQLSLDEQINFGGPGDGSSFASYTQSFLSTTLGGFGDGHGAASNGSPLLDRFFYGGVGDGFQYASSGSPTVDQIFFGGEQDGHAFASSGNIGVDKIFLGGAGDGWASNYLAVTPLPITLLSFTGNQQDGKHILDWETVLEDDAAYFELQRSGTSSAFEKLGTIAAHDANTEEKQYQFVDQQPLVGNNFYRLKMVDKDQKFTYSNVVLLRLLKDKSVIKIYPNPTAAILNIELSGKQDNGEILIDIYDASARLVGRKTIKNNNAIFQMDVSILATGTYAIRIINQDDISVVKFVKN